MKVGVIMGGISSEREISLQSGEQVLLNLNKDKYEEIIPIIIDSKSEVIEKVKGIDFAFLALHGKFGEDGTIQGLLETMGIPYSGCRVLPSAICMSKGLTKRIVKTVGVDTGKWLIVKSIDEIDYKKIKELQYPVFIKPNNGGSSVATFLVRREDEVEMAVREGLKYDNEIIIEEYINGEEITSFVLNGEVFPTVMIKSKKGEFFDYTSKYEENGAAEEVVILEEKLQEKINNISKKVWDILGCNSYARIDMIVRDEIPYLLEVNTLPGMTKQSLIPKSAKVRGLEFSELLDKIIESSLL
ncbi:MAG: D-alanine--D-alanine ligase [Clostridium celatum]|uniref:D-alanine--D-alanine ligase n=1 Tax=uncultured Clostridium sp. TaxID=59620 RepID=UPI0025D9052E|nr:D-alanine--D-alanine ligase [uncultured Clostridium sp.]MDU4884720.1 D-alanine--D-alanine ligase [Clostridium celatum]MDU5263683.1 D-alanine--D-alanine ligase [Clostridium celatum]MDU7077944.1 D-alanine--D-alanine ligase [Clostridium celatum]